MLSKPYRTLIVDDEKDVVELLKEILELHFPGKLAITACVSSDEAKKMIEQETFPLILTDVNMPGVFGEDIINLSRQKFPFSQILVISGMNQRSTVISCMNDGAAYYIKKPFSLGQVVTATTNCLERLDNYFEVMSGGKQPTP